MRNSDRSSSSASLGQVTDFKPDKEMMNDDFLMQHSNSGGSREGSDVIEIQQEKVKPGNSNISSAWTTLMAHANLLVED